MAQPGGNLIIGVDTINARVKILSVPGNQYQRAEISYRDFDRKLMDTGDYVSVIDSVFTDEDAPMLAQNAISIVLPNTLVGFDFVGIPTMSRAKMMDAVKVEFTALYKNNESLMMIPTPILSSKKNALYILLIANRALVNGISQLFTGRKAQVKVKTFESNAAVDAVLQLRPKTRRSSFLYVDIREDNTILAVVNKERTVGYQNLPYGYNILSRKEVNNEYMLIDHDVAELAVINAQEIARRKKLTVDQAEAEELELQALEAEEEARRKAEEEAAAAAVMAATGIDPNADTRTEEEKARDEAQRAVDEEYAEYNEQDPEEKKKDTFDLKAEHHSEHMQEGWQPEHNEGEKMVDLPGMELVDESQQTAQTDVGVTEVRKPTVKVYTKKTPKALPMFMQRPIPETEEGFISENFRIFEKRMLLLKKHCDYDNIMPTPEFILINMPKEYEFIIDQLNGDEDNGIEFRYFDPQADEPPVVAENLDLVGALFAGTWNRQNNL